MTDHDNLIDLSSVIAAVTGHDVDSVEASHTPAAPVVARRVSHDVVEIVYPTIEDWPQKDFFDDAWRGRLVSASETTAVPLKIEGGFLHVVPPANVVDLAAWSQRTASDYLAWSEGEVYAVVTERWRVVPDATPSLLDCTVERANASLENALTLMAPRQTNRGPSPSSR